MTEPVIPINNEVICDECGATGAFVYTHVNKNLCPTCSQTAAYEGTLSL